jgi:hypothetical protein
MTFQEFETLCNSATASGVAVNSPCPIVIGDPGETVKASYNAPPDRRLLVEFREKPDIAALRPIVQTIRLSYDPANNQTVITPVTTGASCDG